MLDAETLNDSSLRARSPRRSIQLSSAACLALALATWGCSSTGETPTVTLQKGSRTAPTTQPARAGGGDSADVDALTKKIQEQAARLEEAMTAANDSAPQSQQPATQPASLAAAPPAQVKWIEIAPPTPPPPPKPAPVAKKDPIPAPQTATKATASADQRDAAVAQLMEQIRAGQDPAMSRALSAATIKALDPSKTLDAEDLKSLTDAQREQVTRYHELVRQLMSQLAAGGRSADSERLISDLRSLITAGEGLKIRQVQLCRRVNGFGVYDAFENNTFLAAREAAMIVYAELDRFKSVKGADESYTVSLSQEIVLYNESDGLAVWRQPAVEVVDKSRNQRRDFFVVQLIRLPARLSVGKYVLKVRIIDTQAGNGGSLDEASVPIQIVADPSLVTSSPKK